MKLSLKKFQSWLEADFDFAPFTVIVGSSNSGKTAIVRSIEAALFNTPGNDYISRGYGRTTIKFENDDIIDYVKEKSARYTINEKIYNPGRGPFEEIDKLGYKEIVADGVKIRPQISRQHDAPFLISSAYSPTVVAAVLNNLSESSQAQQAKRLIEKDIKALSGKLKYKREDLQEINEKIACKKNWDNCTNLNNIIKKLNLEVAAQSYVLEEAEEKIEKLQSLKVEISQLKQIVAQFDQFDQLETQLEVLGSQIEKQENVEKNVQILKKLKKLVKALKELVQYAWEQSKKITFFLSENDQKEKLIGQIIRTENSKHHCDSLQKSLKDYQELTKETKNKLSQFESCPLCGGAL